MCQAGVAGVPAQKKGPPRRAALATRESRATLKSRVDLGGLGCASRDRARARPATRVARIEVSARLRVEGANGRNRDRLATERGGEAGGEHLPPSEVAARVATLPNRAPDRGGRLLRGERERGADAVFRPENVRDLREEARGRVVDLRGDALRGGRGGVRVDRVRILLGAGVLREGETADAGGGDVLRHARLLR